MIEPIFYWLRLALLQRHIYGLKGRNIDVFAENSSLAINPHYIQSWLDLLSRTPRVAPFLQKNDPFIAALKKVWTVPTNYFISLTWFLVFLQAMTWYSAAGTIWTHCWCTRSKWCPWWHVHFLWCHESNSKCVPGIFKLLGIYSASNQHLILGRDYLKDL